MATVDQLRLLISDVGGDSGTDFVFTDEDCESFLEMETHVYRAAGLALRTLAANEALVQKRIKFLEMSTDGAATAASLLKLAESLEGRADQAEDDDTVPVITNFGDSMFTRRDLAREDSKLEGNS